MIRWLTLAVACLFLAAAGARANDGAHKKAEDAYERGDYAAAYTTWKQMARDGNPLAAFRLGQLYRHGRGVRPDPQQALRWFWRAAKQRIAAAHVQIGMMHLAGEHVVKDIVEAWAHVSVATRMGDRRARGLLGYIGVRMDALELWRAKQRSIDIFPQQIELSKTPARQ